MKEQSNGAPGNLIAKTVFKTVGFNRAGARAELIMARRPSPTRGRIHLRRPTFFLSVFPCSRAADHTFGYDAELFGREEIEDKALTGLSGVVKVSHTVVNGRSLLNLDAFAPAAAWAGIGLQSATANNKDTSQKAAS